MSALTHPVGPEPEGVYWVRRLLVVAVIVAMIVVISLIVQALGGGEASAGNAPVIVPSSPPSAPASSSAPASEPPSASPVAVGPASGKAPSTQAATTKASATNSSATNSSATGAPAPASTKASPSGPVICSPTETAVRVSGSGRVKIGQTTSLYVVLLFTGEQACQIDPGTFELKIYSGADRIWSTRDCAASLPKGPWTLKPGVATRFAVNWTTQRSAADCQLSGTLRAGTYVATATLNGGTPNQQVMLLS